MSAINQCNQFLEVGLIRPSYHAIQGILISAVEKSLDVKQASMNKKHINKKNKIHKKCFDEECHSLKDKSRQFAKLKHQNPWNKSLLQKHREILNQYQRVCSFKKYIFWKEEVTKLEQTLSSGQDSGQDFWETLGKMGENKIYSTSPDVSGKTWEEHFKTLFKEHEGEIEDIIPEIKTDINEELNKPSTMTEFQTIISKLKNNSAVGPDRIPDFLNLNLKFGATAETLCEDFITVIHKEGKRSDPDNYRRICQFNIENIEFLVRSETKRILQETKYINNKGNTALVKQALNSEILKEDTRASITCMAKQHEKQIGAYLKENENIWNISRQKLKSAINQYFNQLWVEQTPLYTKAGTYTFKHKVGLESYLVDIANRKHRIKYTKFRLSDHNLLIEEGRKKSPREERMCPLCSQEVEDEIHFVIQCPSKTIERNLLFAEILKTTPRFNSLDPASKFIFLMSQEDKSINKMLIEQIYRWNMVHHRRYV